MQVLGPARRAAGQRHLLRRHPQLEGHPGGLGRLPRGRPRAHRVAGLRGARAAGAGQRPDVRDHVPVLPAVQRDHLPEVRVAVLLAAGVLPAARPAGTWWEVKTEEPGGGGGGGGRGMYRGRGQCVCVCVCVSGGGGGGGGGLTRAVSRILSLSQGAGFISRGGSDVISRGGSME